MSRKIPYKNVMDRIKDDVDYIADEAYRKGLDDAWECIKKIQDMPVDLEIVDELSETERGMGGFGSTGR